MEKLLSYFSTIEPKAYTDQFIFFSFEFFLLYKTFKKIFKLKILDFQILRIFIVLRQFKYK